VRRARHRRSWTRLGWGCSLCYHRRHDKRGCNPLKPSRGEANLGAVLSAQALPVAPASWAAAAEGGGLPQIEPSLARQLLSLGTMGSGRAVKGLAARPADLASVQEDIAGDGNCSVAVEVQALPPVGVARHSADPADKVEDIGGDGNRSVVIDV